MSEDLLGVTLLIPKVVWAPMHNLFIMLIE